MQTRYNHTIFEFLFYLGIAFILCLLSVAAEVDDLKRELTIIQLKINEEEARYQAAKAQMERSQLIAQYLFPELRMREKQIVEKIEKLNGNKE